MGDAAQSARRERAGAAWFATLPIAGRPLLCLAATLGLAGAALGLRLLASPVMPDGYPFVAFFPAVIVTSVLFGWRAGTAQAALCGAIAWYFFVTPERSFALDGEGVVALGFYALVAGIDIVLVHALQRANSRLVNEREVSRRLAETRELLFNELQHRVSNNLQVAAALVTMQRARVTDPSAADALDQTARRLSLVGRISRQLYDPSGEAQPLSAFLTMLARDVIDAGGRVDVKLAIDGDATLRIAADALIPVALIVAEAIANALEHGFADGRAGSITVHVARAGEMLRIDVDDDGHGLPADFAVERCPSLGLRIARALAGGRGGRFALQPRLSGMGASAVLHLPLNTPASSITKVT